MPVLELNASKQITASYLYGADGVVYRKKHTSTPSYEYHLKNALGSTIIETNNSKTVTARYEYDVFGAVRSKTGSSDNVRKFTGKEYDADVKLYYYSARYYDPYIGRFTSRDPIGDGINWYAYVANNPLAFIDPTGLRAVNAVERNALIYTFGQEVGEYLAGVIDIEIKDIDAAGRVPRRTETKILLNAAYNHTKLYDLSVFIHEATHIWQRQTGLHRGGKGGEDYKYTWAQLQNLDLKREEHAEAVQNWFFVSYGIASMKLKNKMVFKQGALDGWNHLYQTNLHIQMVMDAHPGHSMWHSWGLLQAIVEQHYAPVINEIRNPIHIPGLPPQNFPNPAE